MAELQRYGGMWRIYEDTRLFQGDLLYDPDNKHIQLEIIIPEEEGKPPARLPYVGIVPYVNGTLYNNAKMLLLNCTITFGTNHVFQYTHQTIIAEYCFCGLSINCIDEIRFEKAVFDFGNIVKWSGLCKYLWQFDQEENETIIWEHKPPISFILREGVHITIRPENGPICIESVKVETTIEQHIGIEFTYDSPQCWKNIMEDVLSLRYLFGLGMNSVIGIKSAHYFHPSIFLEGSDEDDSKRMFIPSEVWFGDEDKTVTYGNDPYNFAFSLEECIKYNILDLWKEKYAKLKPVLDLYFSSSINHISVPEIVFLNLMQALETFHARFVSDNINEYLVSIDKMVDDFCGDSGIAARWKDFLADQGQRNPKCKTIYLQSRLAYLIFGNGNFPFFTHAFGDNNEFIRKIVATRNYYTHYSEDKKDKAFTKEDLPWINRHLHRLLKYHIIVELGYDKKEARKRCVTEGNSIDDGYSIFTESHRIKQ